MQPITTPALDRTVRAISDHLTVERGETYSDPAIRDALKTWIDRRIDLVMEEMPELLTRRGSEEAIEFARLLREQEFHAAAVQPLLAEVAENAEHEMFAGYRQFSSQRLIAMMAYLSKKAGGVYKTKLNKLLFYADLTHYYLTNCGISGSRYVNLPYGPVPDNFEAMIASGTEQGVITVSSEPEKGESVRAIAAGPKGGDAGDVFTESEMKVMDWVADTYGGLTTSEIVDLSHSERAYSNTHKGEAISYRYAQFLKKLPPDDLLSA